VQFLRNWPEALPKTPLATYSCYRISTASAAAGCRVPDNTSTSVAAKISLSRKPKPNVPFCHCSDVFGNLVQRRRLAEVAVRLPVSVVLRSGRHRMGGAA
jgi:hypothetical protein